MYPTTEACILFADINNSTQLYEQLGDGEAHYLTNKCLDVLTLCTRYYSGKLIKTIGDEVMCQFPNVKQAALAAIQMQKSLSDSKDKDYKTLSIKVGFHFGSIIEQDGDVFGDTVNTAARVLSSANSHQILLDKNTVEKLPAKYRQQTTWVSQYWFKGKTEPFDLYELIWDGSMKATEKLGITAPVSILPEKKKQLKIDFAGRSVTVNTIMPSISLGRSKSNQFILRSELASRTHIRIEYKAPNHFMIIDQSTNGTIIETEGEERYLSSAWQRSHNSHVFNALQ
jgi:class 3 adenylate cyclase